MKPINVVFTGLVRNPELFVRSIKDLAKFRRENMVDKIIFSTWRGEIDKYVGLKNILEDHHCYLVESDPPPVSSTSNIWHQMKSLYLGLQLINDNSYCLKTRADLFIKPEFIRRLIADEDYLNINSADNHNILSKKIWIPYFEITKPFYMSDECFFGKTIDIKKLVNFDASYDALYDIDCGITHIRRFVHPFIQSIPFLKQYLKFAAYSGHFTPLRFEILEYNLKSNFYLYCLAIYYQIVHTYFRVEGDYVPEQFIFRHKYLTPTVSLDKKMFRNNFTREKSWHPRGGHIFAHNEVWLDNLFNHNMHLDDSLSKLYKYLEAPVKYYPDLEDEIIEYRPFIERCKNKNKSAIKKQQQKVPLLSKIRNRIRKS